MKITGFAMACRTFISLSFAMLLTLAANAQNIRSQVSVSRKTITVKEIIEEVQKQTGFSFSYSSRFSDVEKTVTLFSTRTTLRALLRDVSGKTGLRFEQSGDQIVVREATKEELASERDRLADEDDEMGTSQQLQEFEISKSRNRFARTKSDFAAKIPLNNLENPQVYNTITAGLLREQVVTDFGSAMKNTPGLYKIQGSRGINTDGASFYTLRGFRTEAALLDGMPAQTNGEFDPTMVERIEVLKGPSATLFGGAVTSFGGLINVITKKPKDKFGGEVSYSTGSFHLNRITADVYGPLGKDSSLLFRINAAYHHQLSFQDAGFRKLGFVAPAITYRASPRLTVDLNAEFYTAESTNSSSIFLNRTRKFLVDSPEELNFDWTRSYTNNDLTMKTPTTNIRGRISYRLSENWRSQTIISSNTRKSNGYYQYEFIRKATEDSLERNISLQNTVNSVLDIQQNFNGDFRTGSLRHRMVAGLDFLTLRADNDNSPYIVFDFVNGLLNNDPNYVKISRTAVDAKLGASTAAPLRNYTITNVYSVYASDVINITDRLLALLSLRVDRFEGKGTLDRATNKKLVNTEYKQTAVSPKFGVVYQIVKDKVSVFGNYMNGFSNVPPATQPLPDISGSFKPQKANQWEGGVKLDLFDNKLGFTASYYDIKVDNVLRTEVIQREGTSYNITVQNGTQSSKGFELELIANPLAGLNIVAGYGHNNSKLTRSTPQLEGRRPPSAGPADLVNAWISYSLPAGKLRGFGAGIGGNYVSDHLTANSATTGVFILPSYTILNATLFYDAQRFRIAVKLDNATDELYFAGQGVLTPQMPRSITANATVRF